jgi:putative ABC transport system permease protein
MLTMGFILPTRKYTTMQSRIDFMRRMEERLNANATIAGASTASNQPLGGGANRQLEIDGKALSDGETPRTALMLAVGARYFDAVGVSFLRGRTFEPSEGTPGREVVVINQRLATKYFANADPVGQRIRLKEDNPNAPPYAWATIVGVTPNIRQRTGGQGDPEPDPVIYIPHSQNTGIVGLGSVLVRARGNPVEVMPVVRKEIFALDPDLSLANMRTLDEALAQQRWFPRVFGIMFTVFAGIAIVLAAVGLFAVTAYSVTQRVQEIGIRMALGAQRTDVLRFVLRHGMLLAGIGIVVGLAGAFALTRVMRTFLVEVSPTDPLTFLAVPALLGTVTLLACLLPARRATRVQPMVALRYE